MGGFGCDLGPSLIALGLKNATKNSPKAQGQENLSFLKEIFDLELLTNFGKTSFWTPGNLTWSQIAFNEYTFLINQTQYIVFLLVDMLQYILWSCDAWKVFLGILRIIFIATMGYTRKATFGFTDK